MGWVLCPTGSCSCSAARGSPVPRVSAPTEDRTATKDWTWDTGSLRTVTTNNPEAGCVLGEPERTPRKWETICNSSRNSVQPGCQVSRENNDPSPQARPWHRLCRARALPALPQPGCGYPGRRQRVPGTRAEPAVAWPAAQGTRTGARSGACTDERSHAEKEEILYLSRRAAVERGPERRGLCKSRAAAAKVEVEENKSTCCQDLRVHHQCLRDEYQGFSKRETELLQQKRLF